MASDTQLKEVVGAHIAARVKDGEVLGLGTGTTSEAVLRAIGKRIEKEGLHVSGVATSVVVSSLAAEVGVKVRPLSKGLQLDWGYDGADEVTPDKVLLKGRGGAMFREKLLAKILPKMVIAVTEDKLVKNLGDAFPVPVEVFPESLSYVESELLLLGATSIIPRTGTNFYGPLFTENGNHILDVRFSKYTKELEAAIKGITGVIEHGIFSGLPSVEVVVAKKNGEIDSF